LPQVSSVVTPATPKFKTGLYPDKKLLDRIIQGAMWKTIERLNDWIRDEARSPVPVYDPKNYPYKPKHKAYRPKTRQLLISGRVAQGDNGFSLEVSWKTPYAKYLIEKGKAGTARARPYGGYRTLKWMGVVRRVGNLMFMQFLKSEARKYGVEVTHFVKTSKK